MVRTVISAVDPVDGSRVTIKGQFVDEDLGIKAPFSVTPGVGATTASIQADLRKLRDGATVQKDVVTQIPIGDFDIDESADPKQLYGAKLLEYRRLSGVAAFGIDVSADLDALKTELVADFRPEYAEFFAGILG